MEIVEKLINLKKDWDELNNEYRDNGGCNNSFDQERLLAQMRPIENTFRQLGFNVFTWKPEQI